MTFFVENVKILAAADQRSAMGLNIFVGFLATFIFELLHCDAPGCVLDHVKWTKFVFKKLKIYQNAIQDISKIDSLHVSLMALYFIKRHLALHFVANPVQNG